MKTETIIKTVLLLSPVAIFLGIKYSPDALFDRVTRFNEPTIIKCYSGSNEPVFTDRSTGMVQSMETGNGFYYRSSKTGKLVQLYMDCAIVAE